MLDRRRKRCVQRRFYSSPCTLRLAGGFLVSFMLSG